MCLWLISYSQCDLHWWKHGWPDVLIYSWTVRTCAHIMLCSRERCDSCVLCAARCALAEGLLADNDTGAADEEAERELKIAIEMDPQSPEPLQVIELPSLLCLTKTFSDGLVTSENLHTL